MKRFGEDRPSSTTTLGAFVSGLYFIPFFFFFFLLLLRLEKNLSHDDGVRIPIVRMPSTNTSTTTSSRPMVMFASSFEIQEEEDSFINGIFNNNVDDDVEECDIIEEKEATAISALSIALQLVPPIVSVKENGDTEGLEWWLEHENLLQLAWKEWWALLNNNINGNATASWSSMIIDPNLNRAIKRTKHQPTIENEKIVHDLWEEMNCDVKIDTTIATTTKNHNRHLNNNNNVYMYRNFLTTEGIQLLRYYLDLIEINGIPKRRPNSMNRRGLLLDPTIPGGVGISSSSSRGTNNNNSNNDEIDYFDLHRVINHLATEYLRPLGRSFFPKYAGTPTDDSNHYAFTIKYGNSSSPTSDTNTPIDIDTDDTIVDRELKEHSDASLYTLNINLNLPNETYSGSSLYFVMENEDRDDEGDDDDDGTTSKIPSAFANTTTSGTKSYTSSIPSTKTCEMVNFEPGMAILHRGMTKHGTLRPIDVDKNNYSGNGNSNNGNSHGNGNDNGNSNQQRSTTSRTNLVIWLYGSAPLHGYVRIVPYNKNERMSVHDRWWLL